jgi:hypothetical protein
MYQPFVGEDVEGQGGLPKREPTFEFAQQVRTASRHGQWPSGRVAGRRAESAWPGLPFMRAPIHARRRQRGQAGSLHASPRPLPPPNPQPSAPHPTPAPTGTPRMQAVRQGFVRKVLGLLAVQLAITTGIGAAFLWSPPVKGFVAANPWVRGSRVS